MQKKLPILVVFFLVITISISFFNVSARTSSDGGDTGGSTGGDSGGAGDHEDNTPTTTTPSTADTSGTTPGGSTGGDQGTNDPSGPDPSKSVIDNLKTAALTGGTFNGVIDQTVTVSIDGQEVSFGPGDVSISGGTFSGDDVTTGGVSYSETSNQNFEPDHDEGIGSPVPPSEIDDSELFVPAPSDPNEPTTGTDLTTPLPPGTTLTIDPDTGDFVMIDPDTGETRIFTPPAAQTEPAFTIGETNYTIPADEIRRVYDQLDISDLDGSNNPALPVFDMTYSTAAGYTITNTQSTSTISASNINAQNIKDITLVTDSSGAVVAVSLTSTADNNTITIGTMEFLLNTDDTLDLYIDSDGKVFVGMNY